MSTQPHIANDDLDRTDELPVLDVAVYEASLAESQKGLSRTDTWAVEALHDLDEIAESKHLTSNTASNGSKAIDAGALTVNVDQILKRIAVLEADIVAAHEANAELQKRNEAIRADREQQAQRVQALEAENARLSEHRTLSIEMAERVERKLRDELQQANTQIEALRSAHAVAKANADEERSQYQGQIALMTAAAAAQQKDHRALQERLQGSIALANKTAESLAAVEKALGGEKAITAQLTRQFATKLAEYDKVASILEQRNRTIEDLIRDRDAVSDRLQQETASGAELAKQLKSAKENIESARALVREREELVAAKDEQLQQFSSEIAELRACLESTQHRTAAVQQELSVAMKAREAEEQNRLKVAAQLGEAQRQIATLDNELGAARTQIREISEQRDTLLPASAELASRTAELEQRAQELAQVREELANSQRAAQEQIRLLTEERDALLPASALLDERIAELEQRGLELTQLREALETVRASEQEMSTLLNNERGTLSSTSSQLATRTAELEQSVAEAALLREQLAAAHSASQEHVRSLDAKENELASLQTKVREQVGTIRGLEIAVRARDELADQVKGQLQIVRDERAIIAGQLDKVRNRVKSLTQEIFRRDHEIAELRTDLAVHTEALAAIRRDVNRIGTDNGSESVNEIERVLEPVDHSGATIFLTGKMLTIGRTNENDVCIPSKLVSRHHARLLVGPNGVIVEDAGSTNGCFVNGEQVRQHLMHDGDVLELGDTRYRLRTRNSQDTRIRANVVPIFDGRPSS